MRQRMIAVCLMLTGACATPLHSTSEDKDGWSWGIQAPGYDGEPIDRELSPIVVDAAAAKGVPVQFHPESYVAVQFELRDFEDAVGVEIELEFNELEVVVEDDGSAWNWIPESVRWWSDEPSEEEIAARQRHAEYWSTLLLFVEDPYRTSDDPSERWALVEEGRARSRFLSSLAFEEGTYMMVALANAPVYEDQARAQISLSVKADVLQDDFEPTSANDLRARVIDSNLANVSGMRVAVGRHEALTDEDGIALLQGIAPGTYTLKLGLDGTNRGVVHDRGFGEVTTVTVSAVHDRVSSYLVTIPSAVHDCHRSGGEWDIRQRSCIGASAAE